MGFWLIEFIDHLQVVTTNNCNAIADFHTSQNHAVLSSPQGFYKRFLVKASNNSYSSVSVLKFSLNGSSIPTKLFFKGTL
jgi:hypothetical protein